MKSAQLIGLSTVAILTLALAAHGQKYTDPAKADADFAIQGEYEGAKIGVQVIALGDGKFRAVILNGGLPGAGWDGKGRMQMNGARKGQTVNFAKDGDEITIGDGKMVVDKGGEVSELKRVIRHSPTEGAKPPAGAIVLFDGSNADEWTPGKMDGKLLTQGNNSKRKFQSCKLHVEFMTPYVPKGRGQDRGNSGVYMQGRYETQVLDSFGLSNADNECGGIYTIDKSAVQMCYPPLQWQTYDIDFTAAKYENGKKVANARLTVLHNGVKIHDNVEADHATTSAILREGPEAGPIHLQDHGHPVRYRNIWVVEK